MISKFFSVQFMLESIPGILGYLPVTLGIALLATLIGWVIGLLTAIIRIYRVPVLRNIADFYISFIRGTPLMVQIYLTYYGIPILIECYYVLTGRPDAAVNSFQPITFVIIAFAINTGAFNSETIRSAIQSIDKGQVEAAYSVGLTGFQTMKRIVLPQALVVAIPNLGNSFMGMIQGTSLAFTVSVVDIMAEARIIGAREFRYFEVFVVVAFIYWVVCSAFGKVIRMIERKIKIEDNAVA